MDLSLTSLQTSNSKVLPYHKRLLIKNSSRNIHIICRCENYAFNYYSEGQAIHPSDQIALNTQNKDYSNSTMHRIRIIVQSNNVLSDSVPNNLIEEVTE